MLFSIGRTATRRLASTALAATSTSSVVYRATALKAPGIYGCFPRIARGFAAAGRPKKVSASGGAKKTTTKKPAKKSTEKTKAKAKPKSKTKTKAKSKKASPKPRAKKPISEKQKIILERRQLRAAALFSDPKLLAKQPWAVYVVEQTQGTKSANLPERMAALSKEYKALPASELQRLQTKADQNKVANEATYKTWVESHSAQTIYDANLARRALKKKYNIPKGNLKLIHDERLPKKAPGAFSLFNQARWASGELGTGSATASSATVAQEWKNLSPAARKPYEDRARAELDKYHKAKDAVLGRKAARATKS